MVKPAGAKYDVAEMGEMVGDRLKHILLCPIHGASEMPCRHCFPKRNSFAKTAKRFEAAFEKAVKKHQKSKSEDEDEDEDED